jgi:hypothetical protein
VKEVIRLLLVGVASNRNDIKAAKYSLHSIHTRKKLVPLNTYDTENLEKTITEIIQTNFDSAQSAEQIKDLSMMAMVVYFGINKDPAEYEQLLSLATKSRDKAKGALMAARYSFESLGTEYVRSISSILKERSDPDLYREALTGLLKLSESSFKKSKNVLQKAFREGINSRDPVTALHALTYMDFMAQIFSYDRSHHIDQIILIINKKENNTITWKAIKIAEEITGDSLTDKIPTDNQKNTSGRKKISI